MMLLKKLQLSNIRSYTNQTIDFPEGAVLLSGDIGSGKSTILQAVEFALFGTKRKQLSGESLLRHGKSEGAVELHFSIQNQDYVIKRTLKSARGAITQGSGYLLHNGVKKEGTAVELKSMILDKLGYPAEYLSKSHDLIYRYTVYTPQEEMKAILFEDKDLRLETLRRVFAIDKYKRIRENIGVMAKYYREQMKLLEGEILQLSTVEEKLMQLAESMKYSAENIERLHKQVEEKKQIKASIESQLKQFEEGIQKLNEIQKHIEVKQTLLSEHTSKVKSVNEEIETGKNSIAAFQAQKEALSSKTQVVEDLDTLQAEYDRQSQVKSKLENDRATLTEKRSQNLRLIEEKKAEQTRLDELNKNTEQLIANITELKEEVKKEVYLSNSLITIEKELDDLQKGIINSKTRLDSIGEVGDKLQGTNKCPVCLQDVTDDMKKHIAYEHAKQKQQLQRSVDALTAEHSRFAKKKEEVSLQIKTLAENKNKLSSLEATYAHSAKEIEELQTRIKAKETVETQQIELERSLAHIQTEIKKIEPHLISLKEKLSKYSETQKARQNIKELEFKTEELTKLIKQREAEVTVLKTLVADLNKALLNLRQEEEKYSKVKSDYDDKTKTLKLAQEDLHQIDIKLAEAKKMRESLVAQKEAMQDDLHMLKKKRELQTKHKNMKAYMEDNLSKLTETMERAAMQKLYNEFNMYFNQWFNILIEEEALNSRLDDEFTPIIIQNGYETNIENLSGGEKTSLALAYRLALNKVINDFIGEVKTKDIIMLDEPTDGFSSDQLEKVRDVLDELNVRQAIIVSHEPKIESFVDHVIRIRKQEHRSEVTI